MLQRRNRPRNPPQRKLRPLMRPQIPAAADREIPPTGHPKTAIVPPKHNAGKTKAIPHNSKCRYGERGAADAKPKAQIILDAAKVSAASGGCSEPKQGQRSQSARGFCPRSTMRVPQPDIIEHFGNSDAVPQLPERCLSRQAGIVRCCLNPPPVKNPIFAHFTLYKIHTNIKAATPAAWHDTAGVAVIYGR